MKRLILIPVAALAACHSQPTVTATNASVGEVANKVAAAAAKDEFLSPGRWEGNVTIDHVDMPGMPPEMAERMKGMMAKDRGFASCLTPEEAKQPRGRFFGSESANCRYDHFTMAGGAIDAVMTCSQSGMKQVMTMKGNYSPDAYRMAMTMKGEGGSGPHAGLSMAMNMTAKRTGACTGKEDS